MSWSRGRKWVKISFRPLKHHHSLISAG